MGAKLVGQVSNKLNFELFTITVFAHSTDGIRDDGIFSGVVYTFVINVWQNPETAHLVPSKGLEPLTVKRSTN